MVMQQDTELLGALPKDQLIARMTEKIPRAGADNLDEVQTLLTPLSFEVKVIINNIGESNGQPKV